MVAFGDDDVALVALLFVTTATDDVEQHTNWRRAVLIMVRLYVPIHIYGKFATFVT